MKRGIFTAVAASLILSLAGAAHAAGDGGHESGGKKVTGTDSYLPMDTLTATVSQNYRVRGVLQIDAGLEITDSRLRARAEAMRPRLRDAYTAVLAEYVGGAYQPGRAPDANMIGDMMQAATDRTLGEDGADFLLGMVMVHK